MSKRLLGPFTQVLPMSGLPLRGPLADDELPLLEDAGILTEKGRILALGRFADLSEQADHIDEQERPSVALPGLIDCHTHICWAGSRAADYARRLSGMGYQEIAAAGGGILDTVRHTRAASEAELTAGVLARCLRLEQLGVHTCEVKSGYGLSVEHELKMLRAIQAARSQTRVDLIATCLAAHTLPPEAESHEAYLDEIVQRLLPQVREEGLARRVDIFVENGAFSVDNARSFLEKARDLGFGLTVHADQFSVGGAAVGCGARRPQCRASGV